MICNYAPWHHRKQWKDWKSLLADLHYRFWKGQMLAYIICMLHRHRFPWLPSLLSPQQCFTNPPHGVWGEIVARYIIGLDFTAALQNVKGQQTCCGSFLTDCMWRRFVTARACVVQCDASLCCGADSYQVDNTHTHTHTHTIGWAERLKRQSSQPLRMNTLVNC